MFHYQQAVANESGINFISVKGPELLNMVSFVTNDYTVCCVTVFSLRMYIVCRRERESC